MPIVDILVSGHAAVAVVSHNPIMLAQLLVGHWPAGFDKILEFFTLFSRSITALALTAHSFSYLAEVSCCFHSTDYLLCMARADDVHIPQSLMPTQSFVYCPRHLVSIHRILEAFSLLFHARTNLFPIFIVFYVEEFGLCVVL